MGRVWDMECRCSCDVVAKRRGEFYTTPEFHSKKQNGEPDQILSKITIKILSRTSEGIEINGVWLEQGKAWRFQGWLDFVEVREG
ncbi:hypothetical protein GCM10025793_17950 [Lysobacter lycopersici]